MANILVTYYSLTGNTKIIAEAIYETLPPQKEILPLQEVKDINPYDLLFIGFPVHTHSVPYAVELFLRSLPPAKKIALFSTSRSTRTCPHSSSSSKSARNFHLPG